MLAVAPLVTLLTFAPAAGNPVADLLTRLAAAERAVAKEEPGSIDELRAALADFHHLDDLEGIDDAALRARTFGQLALTRELLDAGDESGAAAMMDETIRSAWWTKVPADEVGPRYVELHDERQAALEQAGAASLAVRCGVSCVVFINERHAPDNQAELPLGEYRLFVQATDRSPRVGMRKPVALSEAGARVEVSFEPPPLRRDPEPKAAAITDKPRRTRAGRPRMVPRWVEVAGVVVGALATAAGGVLLYMEGKCVPEPEDACTRLYETQTGGIVMTAVGGALTVTSSVLLGVDEVRIRRGGRAAARFSAGYRWRF